MRWRAPCVLSIAALFVAAQGCATHGNKRIQNDEIVGKIDPGTTTDGEVKEILGDPTKVSYLDGGQTVWEYGLIQAAYKPATFIPVIGIFAGGMNTRTHTLTILFDGEGVVEKLGRGSDSGEGGAVINLKASAPEDESEDGGSEEGGPGPDGQ